MLIVDDEPLFRMLVKEMLEEADLSTVEASSADEAWKFVTGGGRVDLVLTDVRMPGTMDGIDLVHRLKSADPPIPAIIVSAYTAGRSAHGLAPFLSKPFALERAVSLVYETLGIPTPPRAA